jgi:hypothetical protein
MIVLTLALFVLLSLLGAYILFWFLKSSAPIKTRTCLPSGAIGGLVTANGVLFGSYHKIASLGLTTTDNLSPKPRDPSGMQRSVSHA